VARVSDHYDAQRLLRRFSSWCVVLSGCRHNLISAADNDEIIAQSACTMRRTDGRTHVADLCCLQPAAVGQMHAGLTPSDARIVYIVKRLKMLFLHPPGEHGKVGKLESDQRTERMCSWL